MNALVDWISANYVGQTLGYFKTRILIARLDGLTPFKPDVEDLRTIDEAKSYLGRKNSLMIVLRRPRGYGQGALREFLQNSHEAELIWQDPMHLVYRTRPTV